jgi:hypothetical protein
MAAERTWRVMVDLHRSGVFDLDRARELANDLQGIAGTDAVSLDGERVFLYAPSKEDAEGLARFLHGRLPAQAEVTVTRWDDEWMEWLAPGHLPAPGEPELPIELPPLRVTLREADQELSLTPDSPARRRRRQLRLAIVTGLAAVGIVWYVLAPGVAAYQLGSLLILPGLITILWFLRRLPRWLKWTGALASATAGIVGYALIGGDQWWFWGQIAVWPLILLLFGRVRPSAQPAQWYGGPLEGPWGPP